MSKLLSEVYTNAGHYREAMGVHENIIRLVVEGDDDDDRTIDTVEAEEAVRQVELLKLSHQRLGGWDKSASVYTDLVERLYKMPEFKGRKEWKELQTPDKWSGKSKDTATGFFAPPADWRFAKPGAISDKGRLIKSPGVHRPTLGMKRASSNWGFGILDRLLHGHHDEEPMPISKVDLVY
jgi:hypothetical protein